MGIIEEHKEEEDDNVDKLRNMEPKAPRKSIEMQGMLQEFEEAKQQDDKRAEQEGSEDDDDSSDDDEDECLVISKEDLEAVLGFQHCSQDSREFLLKWNIPQRLALQKRTLMDIKPLKAQSQIERFKFSENGTKNAYQSSQTGKNFMSAKNKASNK